MQLNMANERGPIGEHGYLARERFFEVPTGSTIAPNVAEVVHVRFTREVIAAADRVARANGNPPAPRRPQGRTA
jgi:hypothetical protein